MSKLSAQQRLALLEKQVPHDREEMLRHIAEYAGTDLICYRAENSGLAKKQAAAFEPILAWAKEAYKLDFRCSTDLVAVEQPKDSLAKLNTLFAAASDKELAALVMIVPLLGSALLALALWKGRITAEQAIKASHIDEDYQAEQWGVDEDAAKLWEAKQKDIHEAASALVN